MSAFLGPVHFWLYNKIQLQDTLTDALIDGSLPAKDRADFHYALDTAAGTVEHRPLEDVIDQENIHGWLQAQIGIAEYRFASAVTRLLKEDHASVRSLADNALSFGKTHPLKTAGDAAEAFRSLNDALIDGMPCDRVNQITNQTPDSISWYQSEDLHRSWWEKAGGDPADFHIIRNAFAAGMLSASGYSFLMEDGIFHIRKNDREESL